MDKIVCLHYPQVGKEHKHFSLLNEMDTMIIACSTCGKEDWEKSLSDSHLNEIHSTSIVTEADGPQNETKMKMTLGMMRK